MNNLYEMAVEVYGLTQCVCEHVCEFEVETALGKRKIIIRRNQSLRIFFHYFNPDEGKEIMYLTLLPIEGFETAELDISPEDAFSALFELEGIISEKYNYKKAKTDALNDFMSNYQKSIDRTKIPVEKLKEVLEREF